MIFVVKDVLSNLLLKNIEVNKMKYSIPKKLLEIVGYVRNGIEFYIEDDTKKVFEKNDVIVNCHKCNILFIVTARNYRLFDLFECKECYDKKQKEVNK